MFSIIRRTLWASCSIALVGYASLSLATTNTRSLLETTPPAADGALTIEQTPPIKIPQQVSAPTSTNNTQTSVNIPAKPSMPADIVMPPPITTNSVTNSVSR